MRTRCAAAWFVLLALAAAAAVAEERTVYLDELDLSYVRQGWGTPQVRKSVEGTPLRLNGAVFERGVGSHAQCSMYLQLDGKARRFQAVVGVDDERKGAGSITVVISGDGKVLFKSAVLKGGDVPVTVDVNLAGVQQLAIKADDGGDGVSCDHVDWADAKFVTEGVNPSLLAYAPYPPEDRVILTPKPAPAPRINGARVFGVRPGSPFLFRIPATGQRPMRFAVRELPAGLSVDTGTGIIEGTIRDRTPRTYRTTLIAENTLGRCEREFRIVVGDTLALTPPMGWNDWYVHYGRITDALMRQAADAMISSGMADVGYQYVNVDDCWMTRPKKEGEQRAGVGRDDKGDMLSNERFPNMKALADYIHSRGLKAGIYTSPGPTTCCGNEGALGHEEQDARKLAEWGFDFLKYDWCSYGTVAKDTSLEEMKAPYIKMSRCLKALDRDVVFNLCQYGMGDVWTWGAEVGGNCWRTAGDLGMEVDRYHEVARQNAKNWRYAAPGAWNDPDYLLIGEVGYAPKGGMPEPCSLSPSEQYSYISLWCLMAAPLFFSGDMTRLDEFTLNLLCNPEVIDINQDPLGVQGHPVVVQEKENTEVWTKPLEDGSIAVGLFNRAEEKQSVTVRWQDIGAQGQQRVRDLWRQKDLGVFATEFSAPVTRHGVVLVRLWPQ